ncbi:unnamed protein product [[Candida] boidinii]|nr:unnamed protein product [[Candida] boidinii]
MVFLLLKLKVEEDLTIGLSELLTFAGIFDISSLLDLISCIDNLAFPELNIVAGLLLELSSINHKSFKSDKVFVGILSDDTSGVLLRAA